MKVLFSLPLVLLFASTAVVAEPVSREATILALVRATGLEEMLEQSRQAARDQAGQMSQQMFEQILKGSTLTPEQTDAVVVAGRAFAESCAESFDVQDAIAAWSKFYAANLTDKELEQILAYYSSEIGRKDVAASKGAMPQWQAHLAARSDARMQVAADEYVAELRRIVAKP